MKGMPFVWLCDIDEEEYRGAPTEVSISRPCQAQFTMSIHYQDTIPFVVKNVVAVIFTTNLHLPTPVGLPDSFQLDPGEMVCTSIDKDGVKALWRVESGSVVPHCNKGVVDIIATGAPPNQVPKWLQEEIEWAQNASHYATTQFARRDAEMQVSDWMAKVWRLEYEVEPM